MPSHPLRASLLTWSISGLIVIAGLTLWLWPRAVKEAPEAVVVDDFIESIDLPVNAPELQSKTPVLPAQECLADHPILGPISARPGFTLKEMQSAPHGNASLNQLNVHYERDGQTYRYIYINESGEGPQDETQRLFIVDADGLPTRVDMPEAWMDRQPAEVVRDIRSQYTVTTVQKYVDWEIDSETHLNFVTDNDRVQEFMVTTKSAEGRTRVLGCAMPPEASELKCECVK